MQIFIDGYHLFTGAKVIGKDINYASLVDAIAPDSNYHKLRFYTDQDSTNEKQKKFLTWLRTNGFLVITRPAYKNGDGNLVHVDMTSAILTDMMMAACHGEKEMIVVSGSYDLVYAINKLSDFGVRIELASFRDQTPYALAAVADEITNLAEISEIFANRGTTD